MGRNTLYTLSHTRLRFRPKPSLFNMLMRFCTMSGAQSVWDQSIKQVRNKIRRALMYFPFFLLINIKVAASVLFPLRPHENITGVSWGLTRTSQWEQHFHGLQEQLGAVWEPLESRQDHTMVLDLHKLHEVLVTHWKQRHKKRIKRHNTSIRKQNLK